VFIGGTLLPQKKALRWEKQGGKGSKIMAMTDNSCLPATVYVASTSLHEVILVEQTKHNRVSQ